MNTDIAREFTGPTIIDSTGIQGGRGNKGVGKDLVQSRGGTEQWVSPSDPEAAGGGAEGEAVDAGVIDFFAEKGGVDATGEEGGNDIRSLKTEEDGNKVLVLGLEGFEGREEVGGGQNAPTPNHDPAPEVFSFEGEETVMDQPHGVAQIGQKTLPRLAQLDPPPHPPE
jgi:hypothetical protein